MELTHLALQRLFATELGGGSGRGLYRLSPGAKTNILLLDEPVSHLDIKYQVEILSLLKELSARGILVLAVLHDINLASQFCDEILIMKEGTMLCRGNPAEVITPQNIGTAFSTDVEIFDNPSTQRPYIVLQKKKITRLRAV